MVEYVPGEKINLENLLMCLVIFSLVIVYHLSCRTNYVPKHGLRTPNEDINQRYLKNWARVANKISFGRT